MVFRKLPGFTCLLQKNPNQNPTLNGRVYGLGFRVWGFRVRATVLGQAARTAIACLHGEKLVLSSRLLRFRM